ncbi:MAG: DUF4397 domain-containing protein [Gemmatimonadota bacterium]|nr:DUF4397 domain-containing protein [Gemmatimonadota bacterium]MDH3367581.1 DUF4397 domain-containing protein [Gemmatimonadota bacterium]MDH3477411.1 DUF4397 domain-containing protein [Gemmatimonadota bacterium]MDH3569304.1 DUF4397 domain-containing protein [Gemmatimonadota bacterium]MDH5550706.1 DUF4397 domain-containing protein [Gemmatimonadota bacterium]
MKILHSIALVSAMACGVVACDKGTETTPFEPVPLAAVRFVNAVPDTMAMDYRFVDLVTNSGMFDASFRDRQEHYLPIEAGSHTFRVFLSSSDQAVATTVVNETTFSFADGGRYTVLHGGYMRSGSTPAATVTVVEDNAPAPAAGKVALRVLNLAGDLGPVDVFVGTTSTADQVPAATATWTNLAFGTFTPYVDLDTAALRVAATATTTTTPLLVANTAAPAGAAATGTSSAITGVRIAGSVITVVVLPQSVAGSMAPQSSAFQAPAFVFLNDRRPPE